MLKMPTGGEQQAMRPLGKIEVLPSAIRTIAVQATSSCYGVVGLTRPRLRNGRAILLPLERGSEGIQVRIVHDQVHVEVYVALEYGLRMSEIAHTIMSMVKFSIEKMLDVPVARVNVNIQGLIHGPSSDGGTQS
ncbi:MAG TPA: Asp23/Gls24 family envelope stress response protein [Ktedonobacteraceae bacterium]|nr:Asp23/Gls24 family envelope stress response protein [Ktedonobacteraceae bacterium]